MKVLITGASGMLGTEITSLAHHRNHEVTALPRSDFDLSDPVCSGRIVAGEFGDLDIVINCAAYTAVDKAEEEPDLAYAANGLGVGYLARACAMSGAKLLHFSTDYVFDGDARTPYTEDDPVCPIGVYGNSKLQGEEAIHDSGAQAWILRTSWVIGPHGKNFLRTMANRRDDDLGIVNDQTGTPTYAPFLAEKALDLIERNPPPDLFHAAGPEVMTWYELARQIHERMPSAKGSRRPITTAEYPTPARRPVYSALDSTKLSACLGPMPPLSRALDHYFAQSG